MTEWSYPKILVVDDKEENLLAIKTVLKNEKAEIILANSAHQGLQETLQHDFCLILLDVQMPGMNGYEMASILNEEETTSHIPIIFLTAIDEDSEYELKGYEAGGVDVIFKPLKSNMIIQSKVKVFLKIWKQQQKIKSLKEKAEGAAKSKALFLANMSHEIRTPLNSILGFSELLEETSLTDEQKNFLHHVTLSGDMLFDLINDILDFSKIEAGTIELEENVIDLRKIIKDTIEICQFRSLEKNLYLRSAYPDDARSMFMGDETRIRQILINLINNALKFTSEGGVTVSLQNIEQDNENFKITLAVTDTGIGIKEEDIGTIFESFQQADNTITRKYGGTGLGLSIASSFVQMMDGEFNVSSVWGEGTEMSFSLILKPSVEEDKSTVNEVDISGLDLEVLVVDDIKANQYLLRSVLKKFGYKITLAANGQEAVDFLKLNKYDFCFMDINMPIMDGFEATRKIREELHLDLPIIALSADAAKEDVENARKAGMDEYMTKPFKQTKLKEIIQKWTSHK